MFGMNSTRARTDTTTQNPRTSVHRRTVPGVLKRSFGVTPTKHVGLPPPAETPASSFRGRSTKVTLKGRALLLCCTTCAVLLLFFFLFFLVFFTPFLRSTPPIHSLASCSAAARYFMAGEYQPDVIDSAGPFSSFGKQVTQSVAVIQSSGSTASSTRGTRQTRRKRGGATSPSFSMQGRWKPEKPVVDETYQPPLYSSMGEQLEGSRPSVGSVCFASGRGETYSAQHELAQAEEVRTSSSPRLFSRTHSNAPFFLLLSFSFVEYVQAILCCLPLEPRCDLFANNTA